MIFFLLLAACLALFTVAWWNYTKRLNQHNETQHTSWLPCEKFIRITLTPASKSFSKASTVWVLGPMVATILVLLGSPALDLICCVSLLGSNLFHCPNVVLIVRFLLLVLFFARVLVWKIQVTLNRKTSQHGNSPSNKEIFLCIVRRLRSVFLCMCPQENFTTSFWIYSLRFFKRNKWIFNAMPISLTATNTKWPYKLIM